MLIGASLPSEERQQALPQLARKLALAESATGPDRAAIGAEESGAVLAVREVGLEGAGGLGVERAIQIVRQQVDDVATTKHEAPAPVFDHALRRSVGSPPWAPPARALDGARSPPDSATRRGTPPIAFLVIRAPGNGRRGDERHAAGPLRSVRIRDRLRGDPPRQRRPADPGRAAAPALRRARAKRGRERGARSSAGVGGGGRRRQRRGTAPAAGGGGGAAGGLAPG